MFKFLAIKRILCKINDRYQINKLPMLYHGTVKLYDLLFIIAIPIIIIRLLIKSIKLPAYRYRILERFGIFKDPNTHTNSTYIWIHAVSVGEIMAAIPIIQQLKNNIPTISIMLTCTTPRGSEIIKQKLANLVDHVYLPLDFSFAINNFLKKVQPKLLILIEKEIWPNIIIVCNNNHIPIMLANAQLSNKSFKRLVKFKFLFAPILEKVSYILTQTKFDAYKFKRLMKSQACNILVNGNTKFDAISTNILATNNHNFSSNCDLNQSTRPIWIAASTHAGEEQIILAAHKKVIKSIPSAILILVPRHPERAKEIINYLIKQNLSFISYTTQPNVRLIEPSCAIYLIDVIGQLTNLYQISQAAFVGGSLIPGIGGHNVLEPAALALPIVIGSYTENCSDIVGNLQRRQGIVIVKNFEGLAKTIVTWLLNPDIRSLLGNNAKNYLINNQGATHRIIKIIQSITLKIC